MLHLLILQSLDYQMKILLAHVNTCSQVLSVSTSQLTKTRMLGTALFSKTHSLHCVCIAIDATLNFDPNVNFKTIHTKVPAIQVALSRAYNPSLLSRKCRGANDNKELGL